MAATALRKVVVKLESALIVMSPEHQGLIAEENLESDNKINDIRRNVEKQLQSLKLTRSTLRAEVLLTLR